MEITLKCGCGNEETTNSNLNIWENLYLSKFDVYGYDDGNVYVRCKKCDETIDFK